MKRSALLIILGLVVLVIAGCTAPVAQPAPTPTTVVEEAAAEDPGGPVVLTVAGVEETLEFSMEELKALPATTGQAGMVSSTGKITVPAEFKGVLLSDLIDLAGGISPELGISVVANDGYTMTLSYDQVSNGSFIAYDPSDASEKQIDDPLQVLVAYEMSGSPLDARQDGDLRLVIISPKNNQITDGHWSVKWVSRIEVHPLGHEWTLNLSGLKQDMIDRNTFQSCGATSCHQSTWTDDQGQVWAGVPLYLLAGRIDDEISHDGPAYNRDLAEAGYQIELVAADGYTTTIDSQTAFYNRKILVANQVNDGELPDKYFPLRLVGEELEKGQMVGGLTEIRLILEEMGEVEVEPTPEPTSAPDAETAEAEEMPAGTNLWITGKVSNSLALKDEALRAFDVVKITAEHPKKGPMEYEGVYLNALLSLAGVQEGATKLVLTASDDYSSSVDLAAVQACSDCLVAFTDEEGVYNLVMPGMDSGAWIKEVVKIEVE